MFHHRHKSTTTATTTRSHPLPSRRTSCGAASRGRAATTPVFLFTLLLTFSPFSPYSSHSSPSPFASASSSSSLPLFFPSLLRRHSQGRSFGRRKVRSFWLFCFSCSVSDTFSALAVHRRRAAEGGAAELRRGGRGQAVEGGAEQVRGGRRRGSRGRGGRQGGRGRDDAGRKRG